MASRGNFRGVGALLAAVVALGSVTAGCGGGSSETSAAAQPLTKSQFTSQATAICQKSSEEKETRLIAAIERAGGKGLLAASNGELEKLASQVVLPLYGETISQLQDLSPPSKDEAKVAKILGKYEAALKKAEADPSTALGGNPFANADEAAATYGFGCVL